MYDLWKGKAVKYYDGAMVLVLECHGEYFYPLLFRGGSSSTVFNKSPKFIWSVFIPYRPRYVPTGFFVKIK